MRACARRYHVAAMIYPRIDELLERVESRYALVIVAAKRAALLVVAPATATPLARLAHGLAAALLTEAALAHDGPILVAPAMNVRMCGIRRRRRTSRSSSTEVRTSSVRSRASSRRERS